MTTDGEIRNLKRRLYPLLLAIHGVSGVGMPRGTVTVYLSEDSEQVRCDVAAIVAREAPAADVRYVVTGAFHPQ